MRQLTRTSAAVIVAIAFLVGGPALAIAGNAGSGTSSQAHVAPLTGSLGVVTIFANGTVSSALAPISVSGSTYTLTANLNGELRVLASNVVIDGAGFTVNYTAGMLGGDNSSVELTNATHTTVEDLTATNSSIGVWVFNESTASVSGVSASGLGYGILVTNSSEVSVIGNSANYTTQFGVEVVGSTQVTVSDNWVEGNGTSASRYAAYFEESSFLTVTGNHANGSYDGLEADYCHDLLFSGNNASFGADGIGVYDGENAAITNNVAFESEYGTWVEGSTNVTVSGNSEAYDYEPLYDYYDRGLNASNNYAPYNGGLSGGEGIISDGSVNSTFYDNNLSGSMSVAAYIEGGSGIILLDNNLTGAADYAVELYANGGEVSVTGNDMSAVSAFPIPSYTVYVEENYGTALIDHNAMDNLEYAVWIEGSYGPTIVANDSITNASEIAVYEELNYGPVTVEDSDLNGSYYGVYSEEVESGALTVASNWMNGTYYGVYDEDYEYGVTPITITNNVITYAEEGIYTYEVEGPMTITGNDLAFAGEYAIDEEYSYYGTTLVADNNVANSSDEGIYVYEATNVSVLNNWAQNDSSYAIDVEYTQGQTQIVGNDAQYSSSTGVYLYDSSSGGLIADNNVSDSEYGLYIEDNSYPTVVTGNIVVNNSIISLYSDTLSQVSGNDFLDSAELAIGSDTIGLFYHNDINSSSFDAYSDTIGGTWNAPYPIGGNYWTGYVGTDQFSGPSQNVAGSDGIGDTPYTIYNQTDQYPLMTGWYNPVTSFTESGLAAGTSWSVTLGGVTQSALAGGSVDFPQVDGAWTSTDYVVTGPAGYTATPSASALTLKGSDLHVTVVFAPVTYTVTLNETGLPAGTAWGVYVDGAWTNGTVASLNLTLANGSYPYTVALVSGYLATPATGTLSVDGHAVTLTFAFAAAASVTYTFLETGLPTGTSWTVTFDGTAKSSTTNTIAFEENAGAYSYTISGPSGYTMTPSSGSVTPTGGSVTIYVAATTSSPGATTSSGGSTVSSNLFYGVLAGLILALVLAAIGWAMYARRRSNNPPAAASPPRPGGGGVQAWDESSANAGGSAAPPAGATGAPPSPPPPH